MSDVFNERKFKVGDLVTIKRGLSAEYCLSFRVDEGKRCKVVGYRSDGYVRIRILEPAGRKLCWGKEYHWHTAEKTLEPCNRQLTFTFVE